MRCGTVVKRSGGILLTVLSLSACSPAGRVIEGTHPAAGRSIVERHAIAASGARDALEALRLLRHRVSVSSRDIRSRGALHPPLVVIDGVRVSDPVQALTSVPAAAVESIRFLSSAEATGRFGTGAGAGVVVVTTRTG